MTYHYRRVLISYPLGNPNNKETPWSTLHWCDIEQDDDSLIHIRVAEANATTVMPNTEAFVELTEVALTRIRVIELSEGNPAYYCLSKTNTLRRFEFSSYHTLQTRGKKWTPEVEQDEWSETDTLLNNTMRGDADYNALSTIDLTSLQAQHNVWLMPIVETRRIHNDIEARQIQKALMQQQALDEQQRAVSKLHNIWLTTGRNTPITFEEYTGAIRRLNKKQRETIQTHLSARLQLIKQISNSEDAYGNALSNILNRQGYAGILECNSEEASTAEDNHAENHELKSAVKEFHDRFLHPNTLNTLYPDFYNGDTRGRYAQPLRKDVHDYTLDLVLNELIKYQPQYLDQHFQREPSPMAYASQRIDHTPSRERLSPQPNPRSTNSHPVRVRNVSGNRNEYIQDLSESRKTIQQVLLDERVFENPQLKTEIINFLVTDANQLTHMIELLALLEVLTPNEAVDTATRISDFKWVCYAHDITAFRQLSQHYPLLLTMISSRFTHHHLIQLSVLDATIQIIQPKYQQLTTQANQVLHELQDLYRVTPSQGLAQTIQLTVQVLQASPGKERTALLNQYKSHANDIVRNHPSHCWKNLGIAMAILGGLIAVIGGGLLLAGIATTTAAGIIITSGSIVSVAGAASFFHHQSKIQTLDRFVEHVKETDSPLLTCS